MIKIFTNKENFQYDLHSLIKAFYPEQEVKVIQEGEPQADDQYVEVIFSDEKIEVMLAANINGGKKQYTNLLEVDNCDEVTGVFL